MSPVVTGIVCAIVFLIIIQAIAARQRHKKRINQLRLRWGQPKNEYLSIDNIAAYKRLHKQTTFHTLTEQTIADLDLYEVFACIDRTTSRVGQQYLFDKLCNPCGDVEALQASDRQAQFFADNVQVREAAQTALLDLQHSQAYNIVQLLEGKLMQRPSWYWLTIIDTVVVIAMLLLSIWFPVLLIWLMVPFALNLFLHFRNKNNTYRFIWSFPQLNIMLNTAARLCNMELPFQKEEVRKSIQGLKKFQKRSVLLNFGQTGIMDDLNQALMYVLEVIKAFFLVELHVFFALVKELENKQEEVNTVFRFTGSIDLAIAVASLRAGPLNTCRPEFVPAGRQMTIENMVHPLIDNCTPNSINVQDKSVLITGSNMSGKTTFLRTLGINTILAQSIYTCFAERYQAPVIKIYSSIRIDDNLLDGKSYYFEEVNIMSTLVHAAATGQQHIFLLDEVFKGTNTIERIASARAILSWLNQQHNLVFVATHDIELAEMLEHEFELYHFTEDVRDNELLFDHTIKAGPLRTRNAIRILELSHYPAAITEEARRISLLLQQNRSKLS